MPCNIDNTVEPDKVLLLNDTSSWYHFGCYATSAALKEKILSLGYKLSSLPITETYKIKSFPRTYEEFSKPSNFEVFKADNKELISLIESNDIIMINGEGTLHGTHSGPIGLLYTTYAAKKFMNKHVEIINHSVYPEDSLSLNDNEVIKLYKLV